MSWTYLVPSNVQIDSVRLLVSDTSSLCPVFSNEEILLAYQIVGNVWQSGQFYTSPGGAYVPSTPVSYLRVAALLLNGLATNSARLSGLVQLLDVKLDLPKASAALTDAAKNYLEMDDNSGAFVIIEQVNNAWSFQQRWWNQAARMGA